MQLLKNSSKKKKALTIILFFFIFVITVEGFSQIYEFIQAPQCVHHKSEVFSNSEFFLSRLICQDIRLLQLEQDGVLQAKENQHLSTININSHGFRGSEITLNKTNDVYRIFVIGSMAFGTSSTSDDTTIPAFLQKEFDMNSKRKIEVINGATPYSDSFRESFLVKNKILKFNPDLIIVYTGWTEAQQRRINQTISYDSNENDKEFFKFKNFPFYRTPFVLKNIFNTNDLTLDSSSIVSIDKNLKQQVISNWKKNINDICNLGNNNGFKTIVIIQPLTNSGNKELTPFESYYIENDETLDFYFGLVGELDNLENCTDSINFTKIFDNVSEPIFTSKGQTSDLGNEIVAKKMYEIIHTQIN